MLIILNLWRMIIIPFIKYTIVYFISDNTNIIIIFVIIYHNYFWRQQILLFWCTQKRITVYTRYLKLSQDFLTFLELFYKLIFRFYFVFHSFNFDKNVFLSSKDLKNKYKNPHKFSTYNKKSLVECSLLFLWPFEVQISQHWIFTHKLTISP